MDVIVRTVVKGLFPFIILFGLFVTFHGHMTPGGSFSGGAIIASGFALIAVAFGIKDAEKLVSEKKIHLVEGLVALILVSLLLYESFVRLYPGGFAGFGLWNSPDILLLNVFGGLMVTCALMLIVFLMIKE